MTTVNDSLAASDFAIGKKARDGRDYLSAARAFRAGIAKGDKQSANALGEMYILGLGVDKDPVTACELFLKGAKRGMFLLSIITVSVLPKVKAENQIREKR